MYGDAVKYRFFSRTTGKHLGDSVNVLNVQLADHSGELNIVDVVDILWNENKPIPDSILNPFVQLPCSETH